MNKTQLIEVLSAHFDGNRRAAAHALESVVDTVMREVAKGEKVAITGFGAFEKAIRPARMVRNPRTGERTRAKKTAVPRFRPGSELKAVVSGAKKLPKAATSAVSAGRGAATSSRSTGGTSTAKKSGAGKSAASKSTAKKSTGAAKKSTGAAKKSTAKKAPAKKTSTSKSTASKSTAKKAPAKKSSTAKKSGTSKSTAKKTAKKS